MSVQNRVTSLKRQELQDRLTAKVLEVSQEPEYRWGSGFCSFMTDGETPVVRLAAGNCPTGVDLWDGLRSPARVGMYPLGLADIWMHYAAANVRSTRADGSPNPLAMPEPFEVAVERFPRTVILSAMLAAHPQVCEGYAAKIEAGELDPLDSYKRAMSEIADIIHKALAKLALSLVTPGRAVVPMTGKNVDRITDGTRSEYLKGKYHGPCNNHWPQNSIAVMTGLMQFGVSRLPFRDEVAPDGRVRRLNGRYASIVIFDAGDLVTDGSDDVVLLDAARLARLRKLCDWTDASDRVATGRFCTYNLTKPDGSSVCGRCIDACPASALANSSPAPDGRYNEQLLRQKHRFLDGALDFDHGNCSRDRGQKAQLYEDYVCARCEAICTARGVRKPADDVARIHRGT